MTKELYGYEQKINEKFIASLKPCSDRHKNYLEHYSGKEFTLDEFILLKHITDEDKRWVLWNNFLSILDKRKLACVFARHVLHIFKEKYPDDKRPGLALECAENENSTGKERTADAAAVDAAANAANAAYAAANAAAADASAAYAAYAAANAAYAAANAAAYASAADASAAAAAYASANAAAYAADAAADDAAAAAYASADERQFQLEQMVMVIKERKE